MSRSSKFTGSLSPMKKKRRRTKLDRTLTLGDVDLDIEKAYRYFGEEKYAHARQALTRARLRLTAIRGLPRNQALESQQSES